MKNLLERSKPDIINKFSSSERQFLFLIRIGLMSDLPLVLKDYDRLELLAGVSSINWDEVMRYTQQQVMMGIVNRAVCTLPAELAPSPEILCRLFYQSVQIKKKNSLMEIRCKQACSYFANKGFNTMILKGQGLAQLYPESCIRTSGDIDLWVWKEGLSMSQNREIMIDYVNRLMEDHGFPHRIVNYHHIDFPLFKDVEVEVHFTPGLLHNPFRNWRLQQFFIHHRCFAEQGLEDSSFKTDGYSVPTIQMNIPYVISHTFRHLLSEGVGLRQLIDSYIVLRSFSNATLQERKAVIDDLKYLGLLGFSRDLIGALGLFLPSGAWMIVSPNYDRGASLLREMLKAGNLGNRNNVSRLDDNRMIYALKITQLQVRYLFRYPSEVLWSPIFRTWHVLWRIVNGYKYK